MSDPAPAAQAIRARRRRRSFRTPIVLTLAVLLLAGAGVWSWYYLLAEPTSGTGTGTDTKTTTVTTCGAATRGARGKPLPASKVRINVFNATDRPGLAGTVAADFKQRKFLIGRVANDPLRRKVKSTVEVRHGLAGALGARTVMAQVAGAVDVVDSRSDATIDVVLGDSYKELRSKKRAAAALKAMPAPTPPPGC